MSGDSRTPRTQMVRRVYSLAPENLSTGGKPNPNPEYAGAQFDRWMAKVRAEIREKTLEEAATFVESINIGGVFPDYENENDLADAIRALKELSS